ncbi:P-loop containing nucleoside triphosphate hydrolase superfamily protein [Zea mays]|uniref:p-loop containing nucleoside triphosphate hydrolase superfamily protein n=1 Tax=Zea mays TaxID=4577 RepID=A0A1D6G1C2_MAIZE|nr:P-loop containing nucleoside triphosphate hydrolase superfamily protein [Zea mays]
MCCPVGYFLLCLLITPFCVLTCVSIPDTSQVYYHLGKAYYCLVHLEQERFALQESFTFFSLVFEPYMIFLLFVVLYYVYLYVARQTIFSYILLTDTFCGSMVLSG